MNEKDLDAFEFDSWEFFRSATVEDVRDRLDMGCSPNTRSERGFTPLHTAAGATKDPEVIVAILQAGGNARSRTDGNVTPLHSAVGESDEPLVLEFCSGQAPSRMRKTSMTRPPPLHRASDRILGNPNIIEVLLKAGTKPNVMDGSNYSPLHCAA